MMAPLTHKGHGAGGFTLIELLITITILTAITGIVYTSFVSVTDATDRVRVEAEELRLRQFLSKSFTDNFSMAYAPLPDAGSAPPVSDELPPLEEEVEFFEGVSENGADGPQDAVAFWSGAPAMGGVSLPGDRKIIKYEVVTGRGEKYGLSFDGDETETEGADVFLEASEAPVLQGDEVIFEDDEPEDVDDVEFDGPNWRVPIRSMDLTYFDGEEWQDEWLYSDEERLPWAVRIKINFAKTDDRIQQELDEGIDLGEDPDFELIVTMPAGLGLANSVLNLNANQNLVTNNLGTRGNRRSNRFGDEE